MAHAFPSTDLGPGAIERSLAAKAVAALAAAAAILLAALPALAQSPFYAASADELRGEPGSIIRKVRMQGSPPGATAYRVLYRSTGLRGQPIAVSGVVIIPQQVFAGTGRPIVAWAHPTSGVVPRCAPSLADFLYQQIQGLTVMLDRGYIVTATDYPGLGTPGPHPYLVGVSEGRAVLDSIRAARWIAGADAGQRIALWGHSQGGQAVLYAARLARAYAPELDIAGVAAAAPATDLGSLVRDDIATPDGKNLLAMTLWSWSRVFGASLDGIVDPRAIPVVNSLANVCLESPFDILPRRRLSLDLQRRFLIVDDLTQLHPWRELMAQNTVGTLPRRFPVFLAQGTADDTVPPAVTQTYRRRLCATGSAVRFVLIEGVDHTFIAHDSASAAVTWMGERFAGLPPPSDCGR
jgi:acetyl esterase/lipase